MKQKLIGSQAKKNKKAHRSKRIKEAHIQSLVKVNKGTPKHVPQIPKHNMKAIRQQENNHKTQNF